MLDQIISNQGYPVAWVVAPNGATRNLVFSDLAALEAALPSLDQTYDAVYFSVGTAKENLTKEARVESNIHSFRSLWMDVDVKPEDPRHHSSINAAVTKLTEFCTKTNWPLPMIVSSGSGLHFYWPLLQDITVEIWREYVPYLLAAAKHIGLKLDVAASNKATQVMRPTGTTHRKDPANPKQVAVLKSATATDYNILLNRLVQYVKTHQLPLTSVKVGSGNTFAKMMSAAGFEYRPPAQERDHMAMIRGCQQIKAALTEDLPEPVWRGVISTAMLFPKGREFAHILSRNDSRYDPDVTDAKLDQLPAPPLPYTCDSFDQMSPGVCDNCPHRGKIKSPITLGNIVETEELEVEPAPESEAVVAPHTSLQGAEHPSNYMPNDPVAVSTQAGAYKIDAQGCWMMTPAESDDPAILICQQRVWPMKHLFRINEDGNREHFYLFRIETAPTVYNDVVLGGDVVHSEYLYKEMTRFGVVLDKKANFERFGNFMRAHVHSLVQTEPVEIVQTLGWQPDGDFVTGTWAVPKSAQPQRAILGQEVLDAVNNNGMHPTGDYTTWRSIMDVFNTPTQLHAQLGVCAAYAAPLFKFLTIRGMVFSLHGKSGVGKSAIQDACASVWGQPESLKTKAPGTGTGESTISVMRNLGVAKSMPLVMEELTNLKPEFMSEFIHAIAGGKEKSRLRAGGRGEYHRTRGLEWDTVAFSSSNDSIADKLAEAKTDHLAERFRVFEITDLKPLKSPTYQADNLKLKQLESNYGHGGLQYAKYLQYNVDKIPGWIAERIAWLTEQVDAKPEERFWTQAMAAWLVGIELSKYAGLHSYDVPTLEKYIVSQFRAQRGSISGSRESTETYFSEMLNDMLPYALVIDSTNDLIPEGMTAILPKRGSLHMRIDVATGTGFVTVSEVHAWCRRRGIGTSVMKQSGIESGVLANGGTGQRETLGRGVKELAGGGRVNAYKFNLPPDSLALMQEKIKSGDNQDD